MNSEDSSGLSDAVVSRLEETIRLAESETGRATQLFVDTGDNRYIVGDLTERFGGYTITLDADFLWGKERYPVPDQDVAGEYTGP